MARTGIRAEWEGFLPSPPIRPDVRAKNALGLWTRNLASKLLNVPALAQWVVRSEFRDDIALPEFVA